MPPCRMVSFCLPVAGWPLAGASFLFLRAVAATTKVFTSSPTAHASPSSLSPDFTHTLSLWVLVFQSGPHRRSRLFPTDNGPSASVNRTPPTRRHRPGRPLSCRPRALDADCPIPVVRPPSATNSTVSLARRLQIVPAPSVLVANPRGSIPQPPPLHFSVGVLQSPNGAKTRPVGSSYQECAGVWPPNLQQAALRLPTSKAPEVARWLLILRPTHHPGRQLLRRLPSHPATTSGLCVSVRQPAHPRTASGLPASGVLHPGNLFSGRCIQQPASPRATVLSSHPPLALVQDVCVAADWLRREGRDGEQRQHPVYDISGSKYPFIIGLDPFPYP